MQANSSAEFAKLESEENEIENQSEREASNQNADTDTSSIALHDSSSADDDEIGEDRISSYDSDERYSEDSYLDKTLRPDNVLSDAEILARSHPDPSLHDFQPKPEALAPEEQKYASLLG